MVCINWLLSEKLLPSRALGMNVLWAWPPGWVRGISTPGSGSGSSRVCWPGGRQWCKSVREKALDLSVSVGACLTSSLACLDQARLQTCEPVSVLCNACPVRVFQKRRQRSAVPPPEASRPCWWGDQAMAFTAARWSLYCCTGSRLELFHTSN